MMLKRFFPAMCLDKEGCSEDECDGTSVRSFEWSEILDFCFPHYCRCWMSVDASV